MASIDPITVIIRGVTPEDCINVVRTLVDQGLCQIEVPLNSPDAYETIERLKAEFQGAIDLGAGTVTDPRQLDRLVGLPYVLSPNCDPLVIRRAIELGIRPIPGVFTATESFAAIQAGANTLKMFPANLLGVDGIKALKAVLPPVSICSVGGIDLDNAADFAQFGGVGVGSSLYQPGMDLSLLAQRAAQWRTRLPIN